MKHVLLVGVSTRAAAESAARAGFAVTAIDAFGDLDQHPSVRCLSLPRDFGEPMSAHAGARAARNIACDAVAYASSFENHPDAVETLAEGRALWGNVPAVLRRARDPVALARALRQRELDAPETYVVSGVSGTSGSWRAVDTRGGGNIGAETAWLLKPLASGGGHGVRLWRGAGRRAPKSGRVARIPRGCYLQEFVDGTPGSVAFVASDGRAVPLGVFRQLVGESAFGATGYRYCGNILSTAGDPEFDEGLVDAACALAHAVAEEFDLVGVNGIDFVARAGVPYAIEVNPRWSASMELVERACGLSVFGAHAAACDGGALPEFDLARSRPVATTVGKAVVFARRDVVVGNTRAWLADNVDGTAAAIRDVPHPGERIRAGRPVCTVFASGLDTSACYASLVRRAEWVYAELAGASGMSQDFRRTRSARA